MRIGVDLGGTKIEAAAISGTGEIRLRHRVPTPRGDYEGTLRAVHGDSSGVRGAAWLW